MKKTTRTRLNFEHGEIDYDLDLNDLGLFEVRMTIDLTPEEVSCLGEELVRIGQELSKGGFNGWRPGDVVKITKNIHDHGFEVGEFAVIEKKCDSCHDAQYKDEMYVAKNFSSGCWDISRKEGVKIR